MKYQNQINELSKQWMKIQGWNRGQFRNLENAYEILDVLEQLFGLIAKMDERIRYCEGILHAAADEYEGGDGTIYEIYCEFGDDENE